jgi:hypothetical protein
LGNGGAGVFDEDPQGLIGGPGTGQGNVIGDNGGGGLNIQGNGTVVQGNFIGTNRGGTLPFGDGILIGANNTLIGGVGQGAGNTIAFTGGYGVDVDSGTGNSILGNSIYGSSTGGGIVLNAANGANNGQAAPVLTGVSTTGTSTTVTGTLQAAASTSFRVELFASPTMDPSGYGQGQTYLGFTTVTTDGTGHASFTATFSTVVPTGYAVSATATDPGGDTSQFSKDRIVGAYLVTNTADSGLGSLRQAIVDADTLGYGTVAAPDVIAFDIPATDPGYNSTTGAFTIQPHSALPAITDTLILDGYTQPGASPNTLAIGDNAVLRIVLDGSQAGGADGLDLYAGTCTVRGLVIGNFDGIGLALYGNGNLVEGNYVGTDATGTRARGNQWGVWMIYGASDNTVGGTTGSARNLISGNAWDGVQLGYPNHVADAPGNVIEGNFIGTDVTGTVALGNGRAGINVSSEDAGTIIGGASYLTGGELAGAGNLISGNGTGDPGGCGISTLAAGTQVFGNFIGTDLTGTKAIRNSPGGGIVGSGPNTVIGGPNGLGNLISGNAGAGILLKDAQSVGITIQGNLIGTDITGTNGLGNIGVGVYDVDPQSLIGGPEPGQGNVIGANGGGGLLIGGHGTVVQGNFIGTDKSGTLPLGDGIVVGANNTLIGGVGQGAGNTIGFNFNGDPGVDVDSGSGNSILGNSIYGNSGGGTTLNGANNANNMQAAPVLTGASASGGTSVTGTLQSAAGTTFRIEFFASGAADPSGFGQGQTFLGSINVTTGTSGSAGINATGLAALPAGENYISATATNLSTGDTSAFAQDLLLAATATTLTSSANPSPFGQAVTFTATVAATTAGVGTPVGSVTFVDTTTGTTLGTVPLTSGTATLTTSSLPAGANAISAQYSGGSTFGGLYGVIFAASSGGLAQTVSPSILVLDPKASGALALSGNAAIKTAGAVIVDSSSKTALTANGNASLKAATIQVVGGYQKSGNATFSPTPTTGAAYVADPLASYLTMLLPSGMANDGAINVGKGSLMLYPGIYSQISISGTASVTFEPGLYVIQGGGFAVSGGASVSGTGVTIYNTADPVTHTYGSIQLSGSGTFSLSAPTTATAADPFADVVLFQPVATRALSISGNAVAGLTGTVLAPSAQLAMGGNGTFNGTIVVDTLTLSGNVIANSATLSSPAGTVAYSPAQIRTAYGVGGLGLDGTGQTVAVVVAYDDPSIYQSLDAFDSQFGLAATGKSLCEQYGPASAFLTVLNQAGQTTNLPATDPAGPGAANWEAEAALDVEWVHAIAPGAQIILVEANSQSLADLMAGVATASAQPGVSVVSMSWGFTEGLDVLAQDEAAYDSYFTTPGITYVASTGDYGTADPEYPAFSPNVVAVGGTSLTLNANNSYNGETGWGYQSTSLGEFVGSGGGISQYEAEPSYQVGVQSTGYRTTPDVSFVADPATGAWVADPYNLGSSNPWEVAGGTSLSAPCWAGLIALANQGRVSAGQATLGSATPTDAQKALYSLPLSDFHDITSGTNGGYNAAAGYDLVTGLGSPAANLVVPGLIAYNDQFSIPAGETPVNFGPPAPLSGSGNSGGPENVFGALSAWLAGRPGASGLEPGTTSRTAPVPVGAGLDQLLAGNYLAAEVGSASMPVQPGQMTDLLAAALPQVGRDSAGGTGSGSAGTLPRPGERCGTDFAVIEASAGTRSTDDGDAPWPAGVASDWLFAALATTAARRLGTAGRGQ